MASTAPDPLIGTTLDGKYLVAERIGTGGMGTVYRAIHTSLGAPRAIKVMKRDLADDASFVERFQNEARVAEGLRHPNLVALYDFARLPDGAWYIVSELVQGETVAALLAKGVRFPPQDVAHFLGQLCDGLALAHRRGIIHRDISPDNIITARAEGGEPVAKLLDFGIAKSLRVETLQTGSATFSRWRPWGTRWWRGASRGAGTTCNRMCTTCWCGPRPRSKGTSGTAWRSSGSRRSSGRLRGTASAGLRRCRP